MSVSGHKFPTRTISLPLPANGIDFEEVEKGFLQQALAFCENNQCAAARMLGITRYQLRHRATKYGLFTDRNQQRQVESVESVESVG